MIRGVGVDIVEIERIRRAAQNPRFAARLLTEAERALLTGKGGDAAFLAVRVAAKKAGLKALCIGLFDASLHDIEALRAPSGQPVVSLGGAAKAQAQRLGVVRVHISLSHDDGRAVAMAVAEGDAL